VDYEVIDFARVKMVGLQVQQASKAECQGLRHWQAEATFERAGIQFTNGKRSG
jgi:hypothetical protein